MICNNGDEGNRGHSAHIVTSDQKAQHATLGMAKVILPVLERLHAVHHGTVETGR